jgi:flagellar export protein FliJ
MSRKKRIDTVLRVAELREKAARIDLSASQAALVAAQAASAARLQELHALRRLSGMTSTPDLLQSQQTSGLRANAVSDAEKTEAEAREEQERALEEWKLAAQREKALESLAERQREQEEQERMHAEQRMLDDLGSLWSKDKEWDE